MSISSQKKKPGNMMLVLMLPPPNLQLSEDFEVVEVDEQQWKIKAVACCE
jgi:hypothetical protein